MKRTAYILSAALLLCSCNEVKDNTKKAINKTGETIGKVGSEFADGVADGVNKTFKSTLTISDDLQKKGISSGKFSMNDDTHTVSIYLIFNSKFDDTLTAKIFDKEWLEYGRCIAHISGKKGDAQFFDFVFDERTDFEMHSNILIE